MIMNMIRKTKVRILLKVCAILLSLPLFLILYKILIKISIFQSQVASLLGVYLYMLINALGIFHSLLLLNLILNLFLLCRVLKMTYSIYHITLKENIPVTQKHALNLKIFLRSLISLMIWIVNLWLTLEVVLKRTH